MNIEIAPREYWKKLSWMDAKLYCFSLNIDGKIGWRLPTWVEYDNIQGVCGWTEEDSSVYENSHYPLLTSPVRDFKND